MYNVNTPPRTTPRVLGGPMPQTGYNKSWQVSRQPSATAAHVACSSLAQPIPIVPSTSPCHERLLHQGRDQHWAWDRMQRFDSCPSSRLCKRFSLTRLNIVTIVVSHTEPIPSFQILRCLQRFRECVWFDRLRRFLNHRSLSFLVFRLKPPASCCRVGSQSELDRHSQEFQESLEVQCLCRRRHRSVVLALSAW